MQRLSPPLVFSASVVRGAGRGRTIGSPTLNLQLEDIPSTLEEGIYACFVMLGEEGETLPAAIHYGPRPVFNDSQTFEAHILDRTIDHAPDRVQVRVVAYLREVRNYETQELLMEQIQADVAAARAILSDT